MFKPMLAAKKKPSQSLEEYYKVIEKHLPLIVQPKFDGIRCCIQDNHQPMSRTLKLIPNLWIRKCLYDLKLPYGFDGELITYTTGAADDFNLCSSKIMSEFGTPEFKYHVFDWFGLETFERRLSKAEHYLIKSPPELSVCASSICENLNEVKESLDAFLKIRYEGIILRRPSSWYKQGRATQTEGSLMALKPLETSEAFIVGMEELMHNDNILTTSSLGYAQRVSNKQNLRPGNMLGSLVVKDCKTGVAFNIGTGFTELERQLIWEDRASHLDRVITYSYQANRSKKDKPIAPVFKGFRNKEDM